MDYYKVYVVDKKEDKTEELIFYSQHRNLDHAESNCEAINACRRKEARIFRKGELVKSIFPKYMEEE